MRIRMAEAEIRICAERSDDSPGLCLEAPGDLRARVPEAVLFLPRRTDNSCGEYRAEMKEHTVAREVKPADIADDTDPARTARLDPEVRDRLAKKYEKARHALGAGEEHR